MFNSRAKKEVRTTNPPDERGKGGDVPSSELLWKSVEKDNHAPAAMLHTP